MVGQRDKRRCRKIADAQGITDPCSFPTVLAERDGQVLGFLATARSDKAVIAGPLVIAPEARRPVIVMMRLIEAYEVVLKRAGVVSFYFHVAEANPMWRRLVEKMGHKAYHRDDAGQWYRRKVS